MELIAMNSSPDYPYVKTSSDFISHKIRCGGDLYLPDGVQKPPVIIMAHGFGAEKSFGLAPYAEHFAARGMAVYVFDYRTFGDSDGEPRNLVDPARHLQDWTAALSHVRALTQIDATRIALWGSSFSGGHVMVTAAREKGLCAIVAQVPFVDAISTTLKLGPAFLLQALPHGLRDLARMATFRAPHYVKIVGHPDEFAIMNTPDAYDGLMAIKPDNTGWENKCPARILLKFASYRPIASAPKITCPAMLMSAKYDSLIDAKMVEKTANKIPDCEFIQYPIGHFDIYTGPDFERAVFEQARFLASHLQ